MIYLNFVWMCFWRWSVTVETRICHEGEASMLSLTTLRWDCLDVSLCCCTFFFFCHCVVLSVYVKMTGHICHFALCVSVVSSPDQFVSSYNHVSYSRLLSYHFSRGRLVSHLKLSFRSAIIIWNLDDVLCMSFWDRQDDSVGIDFYHPRNCFITTIGSLWYNMSDLNDPSRVDDDV